MKVRFISQYDTYSCGAVALINMHRWFGDRVGSRCLKRIKTECNCRYKHSNGFSGTMPSDLNEYLVRKGVSFCFKYSPNIIEVYDHLVNSGSIIFRTIHDGNGHYSFCHRYDGEYFYIANGYWEMVGWEELKEIIDSKRVYDSSYSINYNSLCLAWFISNSSRNEDD